MLLPRSQVVIDRMCKETTYGVAERGSPVEGGGESLSD